MSARGIGVAAALLAVVAASWLVGPRGAPALAASAAQGLPLAAKACEIDLEGGGFARGTTCSIAGQAVVVDGIRVEGARPVGTARTRTMWLGTDSQGRDVFARFVAAGRRSALVAATASVACLLLAAGFGLAAGAGPRVLSAVSRATTDVFLSVPRLLLLLALALALRRGALGSALAIGMASWMELARIVEADARAAASRPFAAAARASGGSSLRVALRHVLPNVFPVLAAGAAFAAGDAVLLEATLAYLGAGGGTDAVSWGSMIADAQRFLPRGAAAVVAPGTALVAAAWALHAAGAAISGGTSSAPAPSASAGTP